MATLEARDHVVVVGAGLAGWRTCEELRRQGFTGRLTLIGEEPYAPYDRPPLSKQVLAGTWPIDHTTLATPERLAQTRVEMVLGVRATHLDADAVRVTLRDARVVEGTHVVIATGVRARRLAWHTPLLYELRHRDDAQRLRTRLATLDPGDVVAVIGAGFIGAEVATAVAARGLRPVVLEATARPLAGVLGEEVASWLASLPADAGIELRVDQRIRGVETTGDAGDADVVFADGSRLAARAVVVGVGAQPNVEWLADAGLRIDNGVVVDAHQLSRARVAAVGDVANVAWTSGELGRVEHWQVATEHAATLARYWMTGATSAPPIPYFWSDQYARKIQVLGRPRRDDDVVRVTHTDAGQWLGVYSRDGLVTGVVALNQPRALMHSRELLVTPTTLDEALAMAPWA